MRKSTTPGANRRWGQPGRWRAERLPRLQDQRRRRLPAAQDCQPKGFRTSYRTPADYDGTYEFAPRAGHARLSLEDDGALHHARLDALDARYAKADVLVVNDAAAPTSASERSLGRTGCCRWTCLPTRSDAASSAVLDPPRQLGERPARGPADPSYRRRLQQVCQKRT